MAEQKITYDEVRLFSHVDVCVSGRDLLRRKLGAVVDQTGLPCVWNMIDKKMSLTRCACFAYKPEADPFEEEDGAIWSTHSLLFNKALKRVRLLRVRASSVFSVSSQLRPHVGARAMDISPGISEEVTVEAKIQAVKIEDGHVKHKAGDVLEAEDWVTIHCSYINEQVTARLPATAPTLWNYICQVTFPNNRNSAVHHSRLLLNG